MMLTRLLFEAANAVVAVAKLFESNRGKLLKEVLIDMVGAWGFEPQTPTVSR